MNLEIFIIEVHFWKKYSFFLENEFVGLHFNFFSKEKITPFDQM